MAGPISGLTSQNIPLSSPFQPGQNTGQVRTQENQQPQENRVQPQSAAAASAQDSQNAKRDEDRREDRENLNKAAIDLRGEQRRGSLVDISV